MLFGLCPSGYARRTTSSTAPSSYARRELLTDAVDERKGRAVAVRDQRPEAEDALLERQRPQLAEQPLADAAALPLVDDLEGDLGLGCVRVAHEARQTDRAAGRLVDRDDGLATATADVDEPVDVALGEARLRAEKAQPPAPLGEPGEDVEHRLPLTLAKRSEGDCIHDPQRAGPARGWPYG